MPDYPDVDALELALEWETDARAVESAAEDGNLNDEEYQTEAAYAVKQYRDTAALIRYAAACHEALEGGAKNDMTIAVSGTLWSEGDAMEAALAAIRQYVKEK